MNATVGMYLGGFALLGITAWFGVMFYRHWVEIKNAGKAAMIGSWVTIVLLFVIALYLLATDFFGTVVWSLTR